MGAGVRAAAWAAGGKGIMITFGAYACYSCGGLGWGLALGSGERWRQFSWRSGLGAGLAEASASWLLLKHTLAILGVGWAGAQRWGLKARSRGQVLEAWECGLGLGLGAGLLEVRAL